MTRLALIGDSSPGLFGAAVDTFQELLDRGWDAHLLCEGKPDDWSSIERLPASVVRQRVHPPPPHLRRAVPSASLVAGLARGLLAHPVRAPFALACGGRHDRRRLGDRYLDAVLVALQARVIHFATPWAALRRTRLGRATGARLLVEAGESDLPGLRRVGRRARRLWRDADLLLFSDPEVRQRALDLGCPPGRSAVITPSVLDTEWFDPAEHRCPSADGDRPPVLRILSAGPLSWRQGLEDALVAIGHLRDQGMDCSYRIAGEGDYDAALAYAGHQLDLERHVELRPALDRRQLREQLAWADVLLAPAVATERVPMAEAQAMAVPVLATARAGPPQRLPRADDGFLVAPRDPDALADCLRRLVADPALRLRMGRAARARAQKLGSAERLPELESAYASVLRG